MSKGVAPSGPFGVISRYSSPWWRCTADAFSIRPGMPSWPSSAGGGSVRCATDIQAALRTRNDQLPVFRQVRFRIGINLGEVMIHDQDLLGDGVNVAARLQTAAEPGGICISGSVHDQIRNKLSLSFKSLGEITFKNIQKPVKTFSITESEGHGAFPSSQPRGDNSSSAKCAPGDRLVCYEIVAPPGAGGIPPVPAAFLFAELTSPQIGPDRWFRGVPSATALAAGCEIPGRRLSPTRVSPARNLPRRHIGKLAGAGHPWTL